MKFILPFFLLLLPFLTIAQDDWATVGTEWYYGYISDWDSNKNGYLYYSVEKDTVVLGKACRLLRKEQHHLDGGIFKSDYYTYSQNDSVYLFRPEYEDDFRLVFDFSAELGDTLTYDSPYDTAQYVVDELSTIDLAGTDLKHWRLELLSSTGSTCGIFHSYTETIGRLFGFELEGCIIVYSTESNLRCFESENFSYESGVQCDLIEVIDGVDEQIWKPMKVYPNPINISEHRFRIFLPQFTFKNYSQLQLINSQGQMVGRLNVPSGNQNFEFPITDLKAGIYFLSWIVDGQIIQSKQLSLH